MKGKHWTKIAEERMHEELDDFIYDNDLKKEYLRNNNATFIEFVWECYSEELVKKYEDDFFDGNEKFKKWAEQEFKDNLLKK